ncbi:elongation factor G-binding protein [Erwinia sp. CPCC 100877]|nr:elongation factor G-binding protein [Erwinia sp. CPCC 100877]
MNKQIQPYHYNFIRKQAYILLQAHLSVNDKNTIKTLQAVVLEKINEQFGDKQEESQPLLTGFLEAATSKPRLEQYLEGLKEAVIPFDPPSKQQLTKLFKKTKKLKIPDWDTLDLRDYTFYSWNDSGKQQKFIVALIDDQFVGVQGTISPTVQKGICPICYETSEVALFMSKVKESGDGMYTKRGNYICYDSERCNHNIERRTELEDFVKMLLLQNKSYPRL